MGGCVCVCGCECLSDRLSLCREVPQQQCCHWWSSGQDQNTEPHPMGVSREHSLTASGGERREGRGEERYSFLGGREGERERFCIVVHAFPSWLENSILLQSTRHVLNSSSTRCWLQKFLGVLSPQRELAKKSGLWLLWRHKANYCSFTTILWDSFFPSA